MQAAQKDLAAAFSPDYATARARFREAAARAGFVLSVHPIDQVGPDGSELSLDVARKGPAQARRVLAVSSGTHGVEGFFGSAVQLRLLQDLFTRVQWPADVAIVLMHALNPYGFAYSRQVNEQNVDQNRNFLLRDAPFRGAPEVYRELDPLLNPRSAPRPLEPFLLHFAAQLLKRRFSALKTAVATGQYEYPKGLFFGGQRPTRVQEILAANLRSWMGTPERVLHVDFHTGLGKWGTYALCVDLPADHPRVAQLRREFGAGRVQGFDTAGVLYEIRGGLGRWLEQELPGTQYDTLLAEFGSYSSLRVIQSMRFENRVHHFAANQPALVSRARAELREVFAPSAASWRSSVVQSGVQIVEQALTACSA
jgi:hypothetical protein